MSTSQGSMFLEEFPISRDPPEGGTLLELQQADLGASSFQFLGIPPKGEHGWTEQEVKWLLKVSNF